MIDGGLILIIFGFALGCLAPSAPAKRPSGMESRAAHSPRPAVSAEMIDDDLVRGVAAIATIYEIR